MRTEPKLTKNLVSREEAFKLAPDYVKVCERAEGWDDLIFSSILPAFEKLRRGQKVLAYFNGQFVRAKVSSVNHNDYRAIDGPVVRVSNGEVSWRVDGDSYAWPLEEKGKK